MRVGKKSKWQSLAHWQGSSPFSHQAWAGDVWGAVCTSTCMRTPRRKLPCTCGVEAHLTATLLYLLALDGPQARPLLPLRLPSLTLKPLRAPLGNAEATEHLGQWAIHKLCGRGVTHSAGKKTVDTYHKGQTESCHQ